MDHFSATPMASYLAKLERRITLSDEDRKALLDLPTMVRRVAAQKTFVEQGREAICSIFLLEGLISRQRVVGHASQIISINFPGDAVDLQTLFFHRSDHALFAHVPTVIAVVEHAALIELCAQRPYIANLLWHDTLVDSAIFREWAINVGHRRAHDRIGFFLLEAHARLAAIGQAQEGVFQLPLTQQELASAMGLSLVHMNKSLRRLREAGWIETEGREFRMKDLHNLTQAVGFCADYLHINKPPAFEKRLHSPQCPDSVRVAE